jgi:hypothetical protein
MGLEKYWALKGRQKDREQETKYRKQKRKGENYREQMREEQSKKGRRRKMS